jgi:hypothetical protein
VLKLCTHNTFLVILPEITTISYKVEQSNPKNYVKII